MLDAPVGQRLIFLFKHAFAAAWGVYQNFVHPAR